MEDAVVVFIVLPGTLHFLERTPCPISDNGKKPPHPMWRLT
jgi:hypothetical protein